jgi:hypothetical protein
LKRLPHFGEAAFFMREAAIQPARQNHEWTRINTNPRVARMFHSCLFVSSCGSNPEERISGRGGRKVKLCQLITAVVENPTV